MRFRIKNEAGMFWTGSCWGVKQAAEEYSFKTLPRTLEDNNLLTKTIYSLDKECYGFEIRYECDNKRIGYFVEPSKIYYKYQKK